MIASLDYVRPASLAEALELLSGGASAPIAGGHSLLPILKLRLGSSELLVDVRNVLPRGVVRKDGELVIGAATTWRDVLETDFPSSLSLIHECVGRIGDVQVRNHGTVGGSVAHADPSSDFAAVLLATGARVRLISEEGQRELTIQSFYLGPYMTALGTGELVESVVLSDAATYEASSYIAHEDPASGYPIAGAAVTVAVQEDAEATRVALTGVTEQPRRLPRAEAAVRERSLDTLEEEVRIDLAGMTVLDEVRWRADYRSRIAGVVVRRAIDKALSKESRS